MAAPERPTGSSPAVPRTLLLGVALIAATTLMLELLLTRVFDVVLLPNTAYMVITCAVFAYGLAGLYVTVRPFPEQLSVDRVAAVLTLLAGGTSVLLLPAINAIPFKGLPFNQGSWKRELVSFIAVYAALVVPFFLAGLTVTTVFSRHASAIRRLYAWDLAGAAVGCLAVAPLLPRLGAGGLLFVIAALAFLASAVIGRRRRWALGAGFMAVACASVPFVVPPRVLEFRQHTEKRGVMAAQQAGLIEFTRWDPMSKIDVIPLATTPSSLGIRRWHIAYDGGTMSSHFYQFDGNYAALRAAIDSGVPGVTVANFWQRGVLAAHYLKRDHASKVLIFGSAGGQETKAALMYGAARVDAVELVPTVVELGLTRYGPVIGHLFQDPRVTVHVGEGRSFLRATQTRYDIIQIFSNYTSSSIAIGTGALRPIYLQTVEAYREYFGHLTPDGVLQINHFVYPRLVSTAAKAWRDMGRSDFKRHVFVLNRSEGSDNLPTLLIKMSAWTPAEVADLERFFSADPREGRPAVPVNPLMEKGDFLPPVFFTGTYPDSLDARLPYHAGPTTDDRPFFFLLRKRLAPAPIDSTRLVDPSVADFLNGRLRLGFIPVEQLHLVFTGLASLTFVIGAIAIPFRYAPVSLVRGAGMRDLLGYFACLGGGFIILELVLIQLLMRLVGNPLYTFSVAIFVLLLGAGLGSFASEPLGVRVERRWWWPFVGIVGYGLALLLGHGVVFEALLAQSVAIRVAVAGALVFPLGFFLGMPFPLGIRLADRFPPGTVAWGWAMNGVFTVVGGFAAAVLSLLVGFQRTLAVGLLIYVAAAILFAGAQSGSTSR